VVVFLKRAFLVSLLFSMVCVGGEPAAGPPFRIAFAQTLQSQPADGRLYLLISSDGSAEPRLQIKDTPDTQIVFGANVDGLKPGQQFAFAMDASDEVNGYPLQSLSQLPAGEYWVQGLLHHYETFNLATGKTVKLPMDRGEGQHWNLSPGNFLSKPKKITYEPGASEPIDILMDDVIPPIEKPKDTAYIKHIQFQSKLLTEFWGRPMFLGAHILLPEGFDTHPEARYPLIINHGHYPHDFEGFRTTPPDPNMKGVYSKRFNLADYNIIEQQHAWEFYKEWTGPEFPRVILITIQHPTPYYDDSYAVNSANMGPYGDAITFELIPFIEKKFQGIGQGWARFLYGGSTGGWEALAAQIFYPEEYNGCYAACPDPVDFRQYTLVDIYKDQNAYFIDGKWKRTARPGHRNSLGQVDFTLEQSNQRELALGDKSRSGEQWDIWEAVYSPMGEDGYPQRIWDKKTGVINKQVAEYWRENYDLRHILQRDWAELGPKLEGKIHIYCGDMDNWYLNNAVYLMEEFLKTTQNPFYGGEVDYGDRAEHCWNGDHTRPNAISRLRYHQMFIPRAAQRMMKTAPKGADLTSWRY